MLDYNWDANFEVLEEHIKTIVTTVLKNGLPKGVVLNVNFPKAESENDIKGMKICRQAKGNWVEEFDKRQSPSGQRLLLAYRKIC